METNEDRFKSVAGKIRKSAMGRLDHLTESRGLSKYELIQMVIDTLIRYMDDRHNLSYEIEQAMSIFEHMEGWKDAFNLADFSVDFEVQDAIYFIGDPHKKGVRAVMVSKPFMGLWEQTFNIQQIVEQFFAYIMPERYRRLRMLAVEEDCSSLLEFIDKIIDLYTSNADLKSLREPFEDNDRSDYGKKPVDSPYMRKHHKDIETFEQKRIEFEDDCLTPNN